MMSLDKYLPIIFPLTPKLQGLAPKPKQCNFLKSFHEDTNDKTK